MRTGTQNSTCARPRTRTQAHTRTHTFCCLVQLQNYSILEMRHDMQQLLASLLE